MGYTHYWTKPQVIDQKTYRKIQRDMLTALELLPAESPDPEYNGTRIMIIGWDGLPRPIVDSDNFFFNGDFVDDLAHEPFDFPRVVRSVHQLDVENGCFQFCKTAQKPYDLAVCACLLVARVHLRDQMAISSDGKFLAGVWPYAFDIARRAVGPA